MANANVDVVAAIQKFLEDPTRASLELPNLSSQQRKQAKKLIDAHPEVKSESYGFGQDRQLHLFKKFSGAETERRGSSDCSTSASEGGVGLGREHQALSHGLPVRNTFIQFNEASEAPQDNRIVQSMPHGMFSQCLRLEQMSKDAKPPVREQPHQQAGPLVELEQQVVLGEGSHAIVQGLQKLPVFNGQVALVQGWDADAGRYNILLASPDVPGSFQHAKVKPENLRPVVV